MKKQRIYLFDNVKWLLITAVVVGHMIGFYDKGPAIGVYKGIYVWIYSFHMPAFILIAGLFHRNSKTAEKAFSFFSIAVLMKVVELVYNFCLTGKAEFQLLTGSSLAWYMLALAVFNVLAYCLRNVNPRLVLVIALLAGCCSGFSDMGNTLALTRVVVFFPFYHLGTMIDKDRLTTLSEKKALKAVSACILAGWAAVCYLKRNFLFRLLPLFKGKSPFSKLPDTLEPYGVFLRIGCYAVALLITFSLIFLLPNRRLPLLTANGQRTLQVYFWHPVLVVLLTSITPVPGYLTQSLAGKIIYLALGVAMVMLLSLKPFGFPAVTVLKYRLHSKENAKKQESALTNSD